MRTEKRGLWGLLKGVLLPAAAAAVLVFFATALNSLDNGREAENIQQLEEALRRGCVACYASEGVYPPDLDYLEEHYGVQIDRERYIVHYDIFAENLMPDIKVMENEP